MRLQFPDLNLLFGKEVGPLLLRKGSLISGFVSPPVVDDVSTVDTQKELIKEAFRSAGINLPTSMVYTPECSSFSSIEPKKKVGWGVTFSIIWIGSVVLTNKQIAGAAACIYLGLVDQFLSHP